jgi:chromate transporter
MPESPLPSVRPQSTTELFTAFTALAMQGFGGVLAITQRGLCEKRRWLTHSEFVEILSLGQLLPGPNVCNVALMVGDRFFGWRGALAALAGLMVVPLLIVLALTALYLQFASQAMVAGALRGMSAVAAGMVIGTALRLAPALRANPMGVPACIAFAVLAFAGVALLRLPLVWVLLGLGALACALAWFRLGRGRKP